MDSMTAVTCKMGTSHSRACNDITKQIWLLCVSRALGISAAFMPGKENIVAHQESRHINTDMEWKLDSGILNRALEILNFNLKLTFGHLETITNLNLMLVTDQTQRLSLSIVFLSRGQVFTFTYSLLSLLSLE